MRVGLLSIAVTAGCLPASKETVQEPPITSNLTLRAVAQVEIGAADVRNLRVLGDRLYVADENGAFIFDISLPAEPRMLGLTGGPVGQLAAAGDALYTIEVPGDRLRQWDVSDPTTPELVVDERSLTRTFGGIDVRDGLVWHAVGSSPPSRLFYADPLSLASSCLADDQERGIMDVWLFDDFVVLSIHFDDFAGDGLNGNGGFGFATLTIDSRGGCPSTTVRSVVLAPTHGLNRSAFEESSNSDLQAAYDPAARQLFTTSEQRLRRYSVATDATLERIDEIRIPELLDVELDRSRSERPVAGLANGDFALLEIDESGDLAYAGTLETPGTARAVAAAQDGMHFYVADGQNGLLVVAYEESP